MTVPVSEADNLLNTVLYLIKTAFNLITNTVSAVSRAGELMLMLFLVPRTAARAVVKRYRLFSLIQHQIKV